MNNQDGLSILLRVIGRISEDNDSVILLDSVIESYFVRGKMLVVDSFNEVRR